MTVRTFARSPVRGPAAGRGPYTQPVPRRPGTGVRPLPGCSPARLRLRKWRKGPPMTGSSCPRGTDRRRVARSPGGLGTGISRVTGQGRSRGKPSPGRKTAAEILVRTSPGAPCTRRDRLHRALQGIGVPYRCGACGTGGEGRGPPLASEIDHLNGDRPEHLRDLRYLRPSCRSQTPACGRGPSVRDARVSRGARTPVGEEGAGLGPVCRGFESHRAHLCQGCGPRRGPHPCVRLPLRGPLSRAVRGWPGPGPGRLCPGG